MHTESVAPPIKPHKIFASNDEKTNGSKKSKSTTNEKKPANACLIFVNLMPSNMHNKTAIKTKNSILKTAEAK